MKKAIKIVLVINLIVTAILLTVVGITLIMDVIKGGQILNPAVDSETDAAAAFILILILAPLYFLRAMLRVIFIIYLVFAAVQIVVMGLTYYFVSNAKSKNDLIPMAIVNILLGCTVAGILILASRPAIWEQLKIEQKEEI